jgi:nitrous oxidase accessory protein NosD
VKDNTFTGAGLSVTGQEPDDFMHDVEGNTVNGAPLRYLHGVHGKTVEDAGQVIIVGSSEVTVRGVDLSDAAMGLVAAFSTDIRVEDVRSSGNSLGVFAHTVEGLVVQGSEFDENHHVGVFLHAVSDALVQDNRFRDNPWSGLWARSGDGLTVKGNKLVGGFEAIGVFDTPGAKITHNEVYTGLDGIFLLSSPGGLVAHNAVKGDGWRGLSVVASPESKVIHNAVESQLTGVHLAHSPGAGVHNNNIAGNSWYGLRVLDSGQVDATWNWWGSPTGPSEHGGSPLLFGLDEGTLGDRVDGDVGYTPWHKRPVAEAGP